MRLLCLFCLSLLWPVIAQAVSIETRLDEAGETRLRALAQQLRCVTCESQSVHDSQAPLARDVRGALRRQITEGRSDGEILAYMTERYGESILLTPPKNRHTLLLWLLPWLMLGGTVGGYLLLRRRA